MALTTQERIALRIKARREALSIRQEDLAKSLGFKDRQILSTIELGVRRVSAEELASAAKALNVEVEYFTDAFRLEGEGQFSFRAKGVDAPVLDEFKSQAGRWVATYRELTAQAGIPKSFIGHKLNLTKQSSFEAACEAGEEIRRTWRLGNVPSATLEDAVKRELGALVLYVNAPDGISGAASYLPDLHTILINRLEAPGRRNYDLAHELFHLLTWDAMPPAPVEDPDNREKRVEQLADNFAAALLMPADVVMERWQARNDRNIHDWLNQTATYLGVSSIALMWRLHFLDCITRVEINTVDSQLLAINGGLLSDKTPPPPFNDEFVRRVHTAVEAGRISVRRAARILGLKLSEFSDLCSRYGLQLSYDT